MAALIWSGTSLIVLSLPFAWKLGFGILWLVAVGLNIKHFLHQHWRIRRHMDEPM